MSDKKQSTLHVNGVDLNVTDQGKGSPALVFLHVWGGSARIWSDTIDDLAKAHRCIALDFRGWGNSQKGPIAYDLDTLASDVFGLIKQLSLKEFVVIGHSMGGKVAQIVAAHKPEGLKGLVLVAPAPPTPLPVPREERERILRNLNSREGIESLLPILVSESLKPKHHELVIENMLAGDPGAKRAWTDGGMDYDLTAQASKVNVPIRVVVGGNDAVETETALHTAFDKYYPGTDYVVIGGVGHLIPLQAPEQTAKAIREAANR